MSLKKLGFEIMSGLKCDNVPFNCTIVLKLIAVTHLLFIVLFAISYSKEKNLII